jgi:two-component system, cell cycle sensor histidine kinase and response regulator CckA
MPEPTLKVLFLEDNAYDEELSRRELTKSGLAVTARRARTREEFLKELAEFQPDLVLLDYSVPGFGGLLALKAVQEASPDTPCIIVTGSLNEEMAADCIKAGAADYVLKHNMTRLPSAVGRALEKSRIARENRQAQDQLAKINACFLSFGTDPVENISRLTALCGELMQADSAFYNRINEKFMSAVGQWRAPNGFNPVDKPEGRICQKAMAGEPNRLMVARALSSGQYARSPEARHGFATYVGCPVKRGRAPAGSLCALYRRDFEPSGIHERLMGIIAAAIGVEEDRLGMEKARERLAEELRQSHKMEAVGRLAGGVAHDFNNALTSIKGYCELMLAEHKQESQDREDLLAINKSVDYASALTRQLLAFSRKQILSLKLLDLSAAVKNVITLLRRTVGAHIKLEVRLAEGLDPVKADPGQLEQILMNLAINARDAMPDGGTLTFETFATEWAQDPSDGARARYVGLRVADTGTGMDAETQAHIFEPFFTTKGTGKGTGLGLSTVYGIVKQSGGEITVSSVPGQGATFVILLPVFRGLREDADVKPQAFSQAKGGSETILLVEDEPTVRALCTRILRRGGYVVLEAGNAEEAIKAAEGHAGPIPLMITDLVMPGMNGRQLAARIAERLSGLKVLYMSGYADDTVVKHGLLEPGMELLLKPFNASDFMGRVRQLLDR